MAPENTAHPDANYDNANLESANFEKASLNNKSFRGATLTGANLDGANISGADFTGADLRRARMRKAAAFGATFEDAQLDGVDAAGAKLSYGYLTRASLRDANLEDAEFEEALASGACFDRSNLARCLIYGGTFARASFKEAKLTEARISNADLTHADLSHADLFGARLTGLTLDGVTFLNTRLPTGDIHPPPEVPEEELERQLVASEPELRTLMTAGIAMLRYERDGRASDRDQAIALFKAATGSRAFRDRVVFQQLVPKRVDTLADPNVLNRLAWGLKAVHASSGGQPGLRELERQLTAAVDLMPTDLGSRADLAGTLASLREELGRESSDHIAANDALQELEASLATVRRNSPAFAVLSERAADAFHDRGVRTSSRDDFDRAIAIRRAVLEEVSESASLRPGVLLGLGLSLAYRREYQPDVADLTEAIALFTEGARLAITADPPRRADCLHALGHARARLYTTTGVIADLEEGINDITEALQELRHNDARRPRFLGDLASAIRLRARHTRNHDDLVAAVATLEQAIGEVPVADRAIRCGLLQNLGTALADRYSRHGDLADLNRAIAVTEEAAACDDAERGGRLSNLGSLLHLRYQRTNDPDDLSRAVEVIAGSLDIAQVRSINERSGRLQLDRDAINTSDRVVRLVNLGTCLVARHGRVGISEDLTRAIDIFREVRALLPPTAPEWPTVIVNLGSCLLSRYDLTQAASDLDECVALTEEAEANAALLPMHRPRVMLLRALTGAASQVGSSEGDREPTTAAFREASRTALEFAPETARHAGTRWGHWAAATGAWEEAGEAFRYALKGAEAWHRTHAYAADREAATSDAGTLATEAAYAMAKGGDYEQAVVALERGRAIQLSAILEREHALDRLKGTLHADLAAQYADAAGRSEVEGRDILVQPDASNRDERWRARGQALEDLEEVTRRIRSVPGFERFDRSPEFADIARAASRVTLVYLCATAWGGLALIVDRSKAVYPVWLPTLTADGVSTRVSQHLANASSSRVDSFVEPFDKLGAWLWPAVMQAVMRRLASCREVALIACGRLAFLPFHAAWYTEAGKADNRHYVIDDVLITYAPNARVLEQAHRTTTTRTLDSVLFIEEPRPADGALLRFAGAEAHAASQAFPGAFERLAHEQATRSATLQRMSHRSLLHFACHGTSVANRPLESGLVMSGNEVLTVRDILDSELTARLVVLSACDTALPQDRLTDELAGLPGALLQAGVTGVVGSLWMVHDESTANLMSRFYQHLRATTTSPASAFRRAQLELAHTLAPCYWSAFVYIGA